MGNGISLRDPHDSYCRIPVKDALPYVEGDLKEDLETILPFLKGNELWLPISMLMGMSTVLLTLLEQIVSDTHDLGENLFMDFFGLQMKLLVASDDFVEHMSNLDDNDPDFESRVMAAVSVNSIFKKTFGFNESIDKSYGFQGQSMAEYNGQWKFKDVSNTIENKLGALIPAGKNFVDDYQGISNTLRNWCLDGALAPELLPMGLGVTHSTFQRQYNCKAQDGNEGYVGTQLYRINEEHDWQTPPYMGGPCPWSPSTLGLHHLVLGREKNLISEDIIRRIIHKDNPFTFSTHPRDLISTGDMERDFEDPMNNIYKVKFVENRTSLNSKSWVKINNSIKRLVKGIQVVKELAPDLLKRSHVTGSCAKIIGKRLLSKLDSDASPEAVEMAKKIRLQMGIDDSDLV